MEIEKNSPKALLEEVKKCEDEKEQERLIHQYIFDEDKILKKKVFTQCKINNHLFAYGKLLPKEIELTDKKGSVVGRDQVWNPVLITSDKSLIEINKEMELKYKSKFNPLPSELNLGWSLSSINDYLNNCEPNIDKKKLFEKVKSQYEKFLFFREGTWYKIHALWDIGTYFFMLFDVFPIFENRGLSGTAKTKEMVVSSLISFNPTDIMINPSESTLFRETHEKRPTKYIDEAERLFSFNKNSKTMDADPRVELINASYYKNGSVPRVEKVLNKFVVVYYHCYSPTKISSIRGLFGATETRTITHIMTKAPDNDSRGEMEPDINDPQWNFIRDDLHLFALKNWKDVQEGYRNFDIETNLKKRDLQLWKPLLVLAKLIDENLLEEVKDFAEKISSRKRQDFIPEGSFDYKILKATSQLLESENDRIYVQDVRKKYEELFESEKDKLSAGFNRTISARLDNLGFQELRGKDRNGAFFGITKEVWDIVVSPICPDLSPHSSQSSHLPINKVKIGDEQVTNRDEKDKQNCDEGDDCDANDDYSEIEVQKIK